MHPEFMQFMAQERAREFEREASRAILAAQVAAVPEAPLDRQALSVRLCRVGDDQALERLAQLEGRTLPPGFFVIGELDGEVAAAWPLDADEPVLADPFRHTAELVSLLALRVAQVRRAERRLVPRLRRRTAVA
jgi:hypothetical protein